MLLHVQRSNGQNTKIITGGSRSVLAPVKLALLEARSYKNTNRDESFGITDPSTAREDGSSGTKTQQRCGCNSFLKSLNPTPTAVLHQNYR